MRKNVEKVIRAFEYGTSAVGDSKKTVWTDGQKVYSYRMLIAYRNDVGTIYVCSYSSAPSNTTRSQVKALWDAFPDAIEFVGKSTY